MTTADKNPSPYRKVAVNSIDIATIQKLQEAGAIELTPPEWRDRPWNSTTLWHVPVTHIQRLSAETPLNIKNEYEMIRLHGLEFYPD